MARPHLWLRVLRLLTTVDMPVAPVMPEFPSSILSGLSSGQPGQAELKVGVDLVLISRIQTSLDQFGERFGKRIFTPAEWSYAQSAPLLMTERLAARFAAKEATLKALGLAGQGVAWVEMELVRQADGQCHLQLHGKAKRLAERNGIVQSAVSISHDGDYAVALVAAIARKEHV